jgi:hypothetical protein
MLSTNRYRKECSGYLENEEMNKSKIYFYCIILLFFASLCGLWGEENDAEVEVVGEGQNQQEAVRNALRIAVEKVSGVDVYSSSKSSHYQLIRDVILAKAEGYVKSYKILNSGFKAGFYQATVQAIVAKKLLLNDINSTLQLLERKGYPRVMVIMREYIYNSSRQKSTSSSKSTESRMIEYLRDYRFNLIDPDIINNLSEKEKEALREADLSGKEDNLAEMKRVALGLKADIIIKGVAEVKFINRVNAYGVNRFIHQGIAQAKVIRTSTGQILCTINIPYDKCRVVSQDDEEGIQKSFKILGEEISRSVKDKILKEWLEELGESGYGSGRGVTIRISGIDFEKICAYLEYLKSRSDIKVKTDPEMVEDIYEFEITTLIDSNFELMRILTTCRGVPLKVVRAHKDKLIFKMK